MAKNWKSENFFQNLIFTAQLLLLKNGVLICAFGTPEQKAKYIPKLASVEWIGGMAITEPEAGSDVASLKTTAVRDGDEYVVNGNKIFITNANVADVIVFLASEQSHWLTGQLLYVGGGWTMHH